MKISGKPRLLKKINKNIVLNIIREKGPISRAKLSRITGLSKTAMSKIITSLKKDNLTVRAGIGDSTIDGGRRPVLYKFNKNYGYIIGSQIRINEIITAITDFSADIKSEVILKIGKKRDEKSVINKLFESFDYVIDKAGININDLKGIGIGMHGVVNSKKGTLVFAPHFPQLRKNIDFVKITEGKYKVKTYIDNHCRMLVCAEKIFGCGKDYNNIVAIDTEEGIGAGILLRGDIYRGSDFIAGEIGHTTIKPDGPRCFCGKHGCAEVMISTKTLKEKVKSEILNNKESVLYKKYKDNTDMIKLNDIFKAYIEGDKFTEKIMGEIEYWFAITIANTVLSNNPEIIIIQGDYVAASDKFIKGIEKNIKNGIFPCLGVKPIIKLSDLGKYVGPIGAVSLVLSQIINFSSVWK